VRRDELVAGQQYFYRVTETGAPPFVGSFVAPPAPGTPFRFAFIGDTQFYGEDQRRDTRAVVQQIAAFDPQLVISPGDLVASEPGPDGPGGWNQPEQGRFNVLFGLIDHYYYRIGSVAFVHLYTGTTDGYDYEGILNSQTQWLSDTLRGLAAEPTVLWKVVVLHRGPFSQGANHPTDGVAFYNGGNAGRSSWGDLWRRHGVDLVLVGHNHNFTLAEHSGIRYVTSCGGAPPHGLREPWDATTLYAESVCTADLFRVGARTLSMEARRVDGTIIPQATFAMCHADADCSELPNPCSQDVQWACARPVCRSTCVPFAPPSDAGVVFEDAAVVPADDAAAAPDASPASDAAPSPDASARADAAVPAVRDAGAAFVEPGVGCACGVSRPSLFDPIVIAVLALLFRRKTRV